jgi:hypothetical protein
MCLISCAPRPCLDRVAPAAVIVAVAGFVALIVAAMCVYPGGTAWDATTVGHDFWRNYLCDLQRQVALDGRPNAVGSVLARAAMLVIGAGSAFFWLLLARVLDHRPELARPVRVLGCFAALGVAGVALLPVDRFPQVHPLLMLGAGAPGIAASALALGGIVSRKGTFGLVLVGAAALVTSTVELALYARQVLAPAHDPEVLAMLERVALILVIAWMGMVALRNDKGTHS